MRRRVVAVGIGVALGAGLFGMAPRIRENSRQERCIDNLRQIGQAIKLYEEDYDAIMPWAGGWDRIRSVSWLDLVDPYIKQIGPYG